MYPTILWATDGSVGANEALAEAVRLLDPGGKLVAFHAKQVFNGGRVSGVSIFPDEADRIEQLEQAVAELREQGVNAELVVEPTTRGAVTAIAEAAASVGADAIVCSARLHHALLRLLEGSVSSRLIHEAQMPVIVVPQAAERSVAEVAHA